MKTVKQLEHMRDQMFEIRAERDALLRSLIGKRITWKKNGKPCCGHVSNAAFGRVSVTNMATNVSYWVHDYYITSVDGECE